MPDIATALGLDADSRFQIIDNITEQGQSCPTAFLIEQLKPSQTNAADAAPRYWVSARHVWPTEPEPSKSDRVAGASKRAFDKPDTDSDQRKKHAEHPTTI